MRVVDAGGPIPGVHVVPDERAARSVVARLRSAVGSAGEARGRLDGAVAGSWSGKAASGYFEARGELAGRLVELEGLCGRLAAGVEEYTDVLVGCARRARAADERVRAAEVKVAAVAVGEDPAEQRRELEAAQGDLNRAIGDYRDAVARLSDVARSVAQAVEFRPESVADHVRVAAETWAQVAVADPAVAVLSMAEQVLRHPGSAWGVVSGAVGSVWDQVTHPVDTVDEMVGGPHYRAGEWGAGVGTSLSMVAVSKYLKLGDGDGDGGSDDGPGGDDDKDRGGGGGGPGKGKGGQSVDALLAQVELARHEGAGLGHTIERHVDVDDDYLNDRLDNGTLKKDGTYADPPRSVSAWKDQETAERIITGALRDQEDKLRAFAGNQKHSLELHVRLPEGDFGRCIARDDPSRTPRPPDGVRIIIKRSADGLPFIYTAFPTRS